MILALSLAAALASAPTQCSLPTGWSEIAAKKARFILFGETHGTRQSPELVGSVACALASNGDQVLVGVELDSLGNAKLQQLWSTPAQGFAARVLEDLPGFAGRLDGVGSRAMLALLDKLHALTLAGKKVDVVAFNPTKAQEKPWAELPGQGAHEAGQAANIAAAAAQKHYDDILILVGNAHAQKQPVEFSGVTYEPMAMRLASAGSVLTLEEKYASGTMWNCLLKPSSKEKSGEGPARMESDCGDHKTGGDAAAPKTQIGFWSKAKADWDSGYDGYFWFPVVNGSPPAGNGAGD
jgi:hypothetical protein